MQDNNSNDTSMGIMSLPYQIQRDGNLGTYNSPIGQVLEVRVTSYNNLGPTATGCNVQLGGCTVDPRVIPWDTYFYVPDYGYCLAIDIGTWIPDNALDVWLPDGQAGNWGVQYRNITIIGDLANPPSGSPLTSSASSSKPLVRPPSILPLPLPLNPQIQLAQRRQLLLLLQVLPTRLKQPQQQTKHLLLPQPHHIVVPQRNNVL